MVSAKIPESSVRLAAFLLCYCRHLRRDPRLPWLSTSTARVPRAVWNWVTLTGAHVGSGRIRISPKPSSRSRYCTIQKLISLQARAYDEIGRPFSKANSWSSHILLPAVMLPNPPEVAAACASTNKGSTTSRLNRR